MVNMMRRSIYVLTAVVLGIATWPATEAEVDAYSTIGHTWPTNLAPYYINTQSSQQLAPDDVEAAVRAAADVWNTQTAANVQLDYAGTTSGSSLTLNYKNEVFFRNEASGYTAATYWWYNGSGTLINADIVFYEGHTWFTGGIGCANGYYVENTGAHEFGHALGLGHAASDAATMWSSTYACMTSKQTLETDDIVGLEPLYQPTGQPPAQPPAAPTGLNAMPATSEPSVTLAWGGSDGSGGYYVEQSLDGLSFSQIQQLNANALSYTVTGLAAETTYYFRTRAFNSAGTSGYSNIASATTAVAAPAPVRGKKGGGGGGRKGGGRKK